MRTTTLLNALIAVALRPEDNRRHLGQLIEACAERHEQAQSARLIVQTARTTPDGPASHIRTELLNIEHSWAELEQLLQSRNTR